jgi:hypothetical protein
VVALQRIVLVAFPITVYKMNTQTSDPINGIFSTLVNKEKCSSPPGEQIPAQQLFLSLEPA